MCESTLDANYMFHAAPSPPQSVSAVLIKPLLVEVRWRRPALPNGNISHYIVYTILLTPQGAESTEQLKLLVSVELDVIRMLLHIQVFPSTSTVARVALVESSVTYHIRVSAATLVDGTLNEGEMSALNSGAVLYVPKAGSYMQLHVVYAIINCTPVHYIDILHATSLPVPTLIGFLN